MNPFLSPASTASGSVSNNVAHNPFVAPLPSAAHPFGAPGKPQANTFGAPSKQMINPFTADRQNGSPGGSIKNQNLPLPSGTSFGTPLGTTQSTPFAPTSIQTNGTSSVFPSPLYSSTSGFGASSTRPTPFDSNTFSSTNHMAKSIDLSSAQQPSSLANKMDKVLQKEGITKPAWPTTNLGDPNQKGVVEAFWQQSKAYRSKVRATLIRTGYLDDPDKPKKLSEAIDFKGTCEDMCPEFEKLTRIVEHDVQNAEKEKAPDGSLWPSPAKMVKALARSAAGQDAPLPMDVRSPAALRRTVDYLIHTVLEDETQLPSIHGFLWDRTRAIRRDFVFQSSMSSTELLDQVYCLERIARFHVVALHHMSKDGVVAEDFSEQQEVEQLGKTLLSLIHAYEDCQAQGISCANESEFRAYYVLFNGHNSGILEIVQDWGWEFWGKSEEIKIAVSLVETLQNTWDTRGPLRPHSATDVALNAYSRFFSIVEDPKVSYTMACFAEIYLNSVRKSVLKTILASYRKQRDQTRDWTLDRLNSYMRFDNQLEIIAFGEAYGLRFDEIDGEPYLCLNSDEGIIDPFPPLKQPHSYCLVEKKRGNHSLPEVIDSTVYEDVATGAAENVPVNSDLFIADDQSGADSHDPTFPDQSLVNALLSNQTEPKVPFVNGLHEMAGAGQTPIQKTDPSPKPFFDWNAPPKSLDDTFNKPATTISQSHFTDNSLGSQFLPRSTVASGSTPSLFPSSISAKANENALLAHIPPAKPSTDLWGSKDHITSGEPTPSNSLKPNGSVENTFKLTATSFPSAVTNDVTNDGTAVKVGSNPLKTTTHEMSPPASPALPSDPIISSSTKSQTQPSESDLKTTPVPNLSLQNIHATTPGRSPSRQGSSDILPINQEDKAHKVSRMVAFSEWVSLGDGGIIDQFMSYALKDILAETYVNFLEQVEKRREREARRMARKEADAFRYRSLATKYGNLWRAIAHQRWLRRKGREARKARQEMAESLRASRTARSESVVDDFQASVRTSLRSSTENGVPLTGASATTPRSEGKAQIEVENGKRKTSHSTQITPRSTSSPDSPTRSHKRVKSDNPLRRSLLSDPSYLSGGSRIHLLPNYTWSDEVRRQSSGVQTNYFRLKARGITTLPDGSPLATSVAREILPRRPSFNELEGVEGANPQKSRAVTGNHASHAFGFRATADEDAEIQQLKTKAKARLEAVESSELDSNRNYVDADEEELFAKARKIREQMDEDARWFRTEVERETRSGSRS